jgi:NhaP-type Na+/H+ or K+/H+ antiporter
VSPSDLALVAALIFAWGALAARLERSDLTAPIVFMAAGLLLTRGPLGALSISPDPHTVRGLAEATLVLVLFCDASRVDLRALKGDWRLCARLLGGGLPLTIGLGTVLALALLGPLSIWLALLIGAALAPTDAALGAGMILNPRVPERIRRLINVESGLNDGIATPFVSVALAGAAASEAHSAGFGVPTAVAELAVGLAVGAGTGAAGGWLLRGARRRGWAAGEFTGPAVLALAACAYGASLALHGNGFIAAFTGGLAFGATAGRRGQGLVPFVEDVGGLVSLAVWLAFGAVAIAPAFTGLTWRVALYAGLSLTVVRMVPVALALTGSELGWTARLFVGWFGPRGLASIVFGLLAVEALGLTAAGPVVRAIGITVVLSAVAHGATAGPLARRYAARLGPGLPVAAVAATPGMPVRRLVRREAQAREAPAPDGEPRA